MVVVELGGPVTGSLSVWELTASKEITDRAGNRLAGSWSSVAEPYVGYFGALLANVQPVDRCEVSEAAFRPDGDDGRSGRGRRGCRGWSPALRRFGGS